MNRALTAIVLMVAVVNTTAQAQNQASHSSVSFGNRYFVGEVFTGYYDGVGLRVNGTIVNFAESFPFQVRLGLGYSRVQTGDAMRARRVFIDQNTNGEPRSRGSNWDAALDILYPINLFSLKQSRVYGGLRHSAFNAYFEYIGGNETFDVVSSPWGLGGGMETMFALTPRVNMVLSAGVDYYFRSLIAGHDTYYRPNGDDLNEKEDFTYKDADECIAQPDLNTRLMLGLAYRF